jgi:hypothetical protein
VLLERYYSIKHTNLDISDLIDSLWPTLSFMQVENEILEDGYQEDVIGEITPDLVIENFMRGERQIIERLLQTEIAMLRAIRDGSALMQHMEDFYYIALLERVERKMSRLRS